MRFKGPIADTRLKVSNPEEAQALVSSAVGALDRLEPLIDEETRLFKAGKVRDALGMALEKNEAAQTFPTPGLCPNAEACPSLSEESLPCPRRAVLREH